MKSKFETYLKNQGYSQKTPSGHPSTVYDYIKRIDNVCKEENMNWEELASQIEAIVSLYDTDGEKESLGNKSNRAVINALKRFSEFLEKQ